MYYLKRSTNFLFFWEVIHSHILDFSRYIIFLWIFNSFSLPFDHHLLYNNLVIRDICLCIS